MSSPTIGLLTIGQAPRRDGLASDVRKVLGDVRVLERGALDGVTDGEIAEMSPSEDDYRLITLLQDGRSVEVAKRHLLPRLQAQIEDLEDEGVGVTLLMCTGEFPSFRHRRPLLAPQSALYAVVTALAAGGRVASLTPLASQVTQARRKWSSMGVDAFVVDADPYCSDPVPGVAAAAGRAADAGAAVCFLDCFGYDLRMRDAAREAFPGQVVLARSLAARLAAEVAL
ncbi:MAG: AroM family protein [Trueperaceae bacterium]